MAYIDLDKVINITGGSTGTYPDGSPYPVLQQSIGLFNKEDAWNAGASEGWMGLLYSDNNSINAQNNSWNTQYTPAIFQGTGALSSKVKSYAFSADIDTVDGGKVVGGVYRKYTNSLFTVNEITPGISNSAVSDNYLSSDSKKAYIVTSGANKLFCKITGDKTLSIFNAGVNGEPLGVATSITSLPAPAFSNYGAQSHTIYRSAIIGISGNYIHVAVGGSSTAWSGSSGTAVASELRVSTHIYQIQSDGTILLVDTSDSFIDVSNGFGIGDSGNGRNLDIGSYQIGNTGYLYINGRAYQSTGSGTACSVVGAGVHSYDLTQTIVAETIEYRTENSVASGAVLPFYIAPTNSESIFGNDGTNSYVVDGNGDIQQIDGTGITDSGSNYFSGTIGYWCRYRNSVAKLSSSVANTYMNNDIMTVNDSNLGGTLTSLYNNVTMVFEMDGVSEEDDLAIFRGYHINAVATKENSDLVNLLFNGVVVDSFVLDSNTINATTEYFIEFTAFSGSIIGSTDIEIEIEYANTNAEDLKLGFDLTGGDYAAPTGANDLSGNATTQWTPGANATYLNLTLTA